MACDSVALRGAVLWFAELRLIVYSCRCFARVNSPSRCHGIYAVSHVLHVSVRSRRFTVMISTHTVLEKFAKICLG